MTSAMRRDGYVIGVPYIEQVTSELCPAWFSMSLAMHGQPPLPNDRPIVWAELGCGTGMTACVVAAANSNTEVWGFDFNPDHIRRACHLQEAAQIDTATFLETSFEELANDPTIGPNEVDVIVVHGVYSWVSSQQQGHIISFVNDRLRPGGVAYLSYEVATGWSSMPPIAELMRLLTEEDERPITTSIFESLETIGRLSDSGARYFPIGNQEQAQLRSLASSDPRYAVHEYLGEHFRPLMFDEVAASMATAGCEFVGSIEPTDALSEFWVDPALAEIVRGLGDGVVRGMLRDLCTQRPLRRDLFRKGLEAPDDARRAAWLESISLVGLGKTLDPGTTALVPLGDVQIDRSYFEPLLQLLEAGPLDISAARSIRPDAELPELVRAMALLVGAELAAPAAAIDADSVERSRRLNVALTSENAAATAHDRLASPLIGSGIDVEWVESLMLHRLLMGLDADAGAIQTFVQTVEDQKRALLDREGRPVPPDSLEVEISLRERQAQARLDLLARHGLI